MADKLELNGAPAEEEASGGAAGLNGAPGGEEASGGASGKKTKPGSKSTTHRQKKSHAPIPARFMAAVGGALSPGEKSVFQRWNSVRRSLGMLQGGRERSPRPKSLATIPDEAQGITPHNKKVKKVKHTPGDCDSPSDPTTPSDVASPGETSFFKKMDVVRRSLKMPKWETPPKSQPLTPVSDAKVTLDSTEVTKVAERAEVSESYTLPPGPSTLPSVLEVNSLIDSGDLLVALVNLLCLRQELQESGLSPAERQEREKDLHQLYSALRGKMADIVRQSSVLPARNKELLVQVARVVQEEERREGEVGGLGGWREAWRGAVRDGVRDVLKGVHLDTPEHNPSWLAMHLGLLGKAIVENLERVKAELKCSYPPSFRVFDEYVMAWHSAVRDHLTHLTPSLTETKDCYALLHFIYKQYSSERILGNEVLLPDMREELKSLTMDKKALEQLKAKYCSQLQAEVQSLLSGVIRVEKQSLWEPKAKIKDDLREEPVSTLVHDIAQMVAEKEKTSRTVSPDLALKATHICLEELQCFPKQLEKEFSQSTSQLRSSDVLDQSLWVSYNITYINSFNSLRGHMESYRGSSPDQVTRLSEELEGAELRFREALLQHFKTDISPFTQTLMTKPWLTEDEDFREICSRVQTLYDQSAEMKQPLRQEFVDQLHLLVVREYVSPLLHSTYSCKNRKNQQAAHKLKEELEQLNKLFKDMKSTEVWLHPLGDYLSDIINQKNESDIKHVLEPLVTDFPDISEKQLVCVLNFRSQSWTPEKLRLQSRLTKLKSKQQPGESHRTFFTDI